MEAMASRLSFGGLLGLGLLAFLGYQYYQSSSDADLCSRQATKETLSGLLNNNNIGNSLQVSAIRTDKQDGRKTICAAQFDWTRTDNSKAETLASVHYSVIRTDDQKQIMVEIPPADAIALRMEGAAE